MALGNATISVGGGTQLLYLPDVRSPVNNSTVGGLNNTLINGFSLNDDLDDEFGWNVNGAISFPTAAGNTLSLLGFWANVNDEDTVVCGGNATSGCATAPLVDDPTLVQRFGQIGQPGDGLVSRSERDVDIWGVAFESKWDLTPDIMGVTKAPSHRFWALGADIRGIHQDTNATITGLNPGFNATYSEDLDTTYYGAYAAWGGGYTPFLFKGLWQRWGLQSSFRLQGGLYYADVDYDGALVNANNAAGTSTLSLSESEFAFIGGIKLTTSKQIGERAKLSLTSEYEYYSYAPDVLLNQRDVAGANIANAAGQAGTVIDDDDGFSMRTSLRLTIGLGSRDLYREPLK